MWSTDGGRSSSAARVADTYRQKLLNCRKKFRLRRISEVQPDLRGSLIFLLAVKSSCAGPAERAPGPGRIDSDCIRVAPYLTFAKSTRLPILLCKFFNLAGAPKCSVRSTSYCSFGKMGNPGTNIDFVFFLSYGKPLRKIF